MNLPDDPASTLRAALRRAHFDQRRVPQALGHIAWSARALDSPYWTRNFADGPLVVLIDTFIRGREVERSALKGSLGEDGLAAAELLGLLRSGLDTDRVVSTLLMLPLGEDLVLMDHPARSGADDGLFLADSTTWTLRRLVRGPRVGRHLDLGAGGGGVTVAAARTADHTVGLDINPRAAGILSLSARLSGVEVESLVGDASQLADLGTFDRVSFVLPMLSRRLDMDDAPIHTLGNAGLLEAVIRQLPTLLAPGGLALLYTQVVLPGGSLPEVLSSAFNGRDFRARLWLDWVSETADGPVRGGVLGLRADRPGRYDEADATPDRPGDDDGSAQLVVLER